MRNLQEFTKEFIATAIDYQEENDWFLNDEIITKDTDINTILTEIEDLNYDVGVDILYMMQERKSWQVSIESDEDSAIIESVGVIIDCKNMFDLPIVIVIDTEVEFDFSSIEKLYEQMNFYDNFVEKIRTKFNIK